MAEDTTNPLDELAELIQTLQTADSKERLGLFADFFDADRIGKFALVPKADDMRLETLFMQLGSVRGMSGRAKDTLKLVRKAQRQAMSEAEDLLNQISNMGLFKDSLPDYLTDKIPNYLVPGGYEIDLGGVYSMQADDFGNTKRVKIATAPIIIMKRGRDAETGHMQIEVAWVEPPPPGAGKPSWRTRTVERSVAFDSKKLTSLIDFGAPVTSVNIGDVIRWMTAFEDINQTKIPLVNGASRLGWQRDGSFLLPDGHIRTEAQQELKLFPVEGMDPVMRSLKTGGTWEGWLQTIEFLRDHPLAMLAIYSSVASCLNKIVRCSNFAIDWSNETSKGKTTSLRVGASVWGYPSDNDEEGFIYSWDSTKVWVERAAGFLNSLPLILDETKRVKHKKHVADVLYDFCSGKGRGRGTLQGVQASLTWNAVLMSTGEQRLTSFTNDGGTRARVLAVVGAPISGPAQTARVVADTVRGRLHAHYGHLGRKVVQYLVYHTDSWDDFRAAFESRRDSYASITNTAVGGRLAAYVACIDLAQAICEALGVPTPHEDPIQYLIQAIREGADDSDRARDAFLSAASWAALNRHRFYKSLAAEKEGRAFGGYVGRWTDGDPNWTFIAFEKSELRKMLDSRSFNYDEVVPQWRARGWLRDTQRGPTYNCSVEGVSVPCVCMRREIYEEILRKEAPKVVDLEAPVAQVALIEETVSYEDATWSSLADYN